MKKLALLIIIASSFLGMQKATAQVAVGVSVGIAPPELPIYEQPPCPSDGYLWSPGYWAYGPDGYYWVPGVWVSPPQVGFLWTPGYWGFNNGGYYWNGGYWGENVGFYGGVCYGYGYGGSGFYGGRWQGGRFQYNTAACHVGGGIHNTYSDRTVIVNNSNRSSFNGRGGVLAQPNAREQSAANEHHVQATSAQQTHQQKASANKNQLSTANGGHPATTARSTVGGERFNSAGHSISTVHSNAANHMSNPVAQHPANAPHANAPRPQAQQQRPVQSRPAPQQQQQRPMQNRPAPPQQHSQPAQNRPAPQHQNGGMQRQAQPSGGGHPSGGGGGHPGGGEGKH